MAQRQRFVRKPQIALDLQPGSWTSRSAGSGGRYSGHNRATCSRNTDDAPGQPTCSASAVAGIRGEAATRRTDRSSRPKLFVVEETLTPGNFLRARDF